MGSSDRRRIDRATTLSGRQSLERALNSWIRLREAWSSIASAARAVENWERMALADSKLDECKSNISRIQMELHAKNETT
jgi:hypothetical protein